MKRLLLKRELRWFSWDQEVSQQLEKADSYPIPSLLPLVVGEDFSVPIKWSLFVFFWTWKNQGILCVILCHGWEMRQESAYFTNVIIIFDTLCLWHSCSTHDQRLMQAHEPTFHWFRFFPRCVQISFFNFCLFLLWNLNFKLFQNKHI